MKSLILGAICFLAMGTSAHAMYSCSASSLVSKRLSVSTIGFTQILTQASAINKCEQIYTICKPLGCTKIN